MTIEEQLSQIQQDVVFCRTKIEEHNRFAERMLVVEKDLQKLSGATGLLKFALPIVLTVVVLVLEIIL